MDYHLLFKTFRIICNPLFYYLFFVWLLLACESNSKGQFEIYNDKSYYYHYRNLDSTEYYAKYVIDRTLNNPDVKAEALNNLAFVCISKMDYQKASKLLYDAIELTDNQIELLVSDVLLMRLCQRKSNNREFYEYRNRALKRLDRINEERNSLSERMQKRLLYAETEFAIVSSAYFYYIGLLSQSRNAILDRHINGIIKNDTAQYLNYLYNIGAGGILEGSKDDIVQKEFEYLIKCYALAKQTESIFFEANSLEALSLQFTDKQSSNLIINNNPISMKYLLDYEIVTEDIAVHLATQSLHLFEANGDIYQIAGANRTLASCYMAKGEYNKAIEYLDKALSDERISQAPDLVASIREQLSVAYSAINDKQLSDFNRNIYLGLHEQTRQDRELEARADMLNKVSLQQNTMILIVLFAIVLTLIMLWILNYLNNKRSDKDSIENLLNPLHLWRDNNNKKIKSLREQKAEIKEKLSITLDRANNVQIKLLENRTRISLVNGMIPFIDRMINEINMLRERDETEDVKNKRHEYIHELIDKINEYNETLTNWIEIRRGNLYMRIESFPLQLIFNVLIKGKAVFAMKGIDLYVEETKAIVKADRALTLFMINTLADNARKFTSQGGRVEIKAIESDEYVEISVCDTGEGLTQEQLKNIFEKKVYNGNGFGLLNCKGIIDKYRKTSKIFNVCSIYAESEKGRGSKFCIRLPRGVIRSLVILSMIMNVVLCGAFENEILQTDLAKANAYADSAYLSNIEGTYHETLEYAGNCLRLLNKHYLSQKPDGDNLMNLNGELNNDYSDLIWYRDSIATDYHIILDIRNEIAVAALALHDWDLYEYNNRIYTQLFKELSADNTLSAYCKMMQQTQVNKRIAIIILVIIFLMILPAYYLIYYRHRIYYKYCLEKINKVNDILLSSIDSREKLNKIDSLLDEQFPTELQEVVLQIRTALVDANDLYNSQLVDIEMAQDENRKIELENDKMYVCNSIFDNCLSALKHETMYYPNRLRKLLDDKIPNLELISELASYYRDIHVGLSTQAAQQLTKIKHRVGKVDIMGFKVIGNIDLLNYLFNYIQNNSEYKINKIETTEIYSGYICFNFYISAFKFSGLQIKDFFNPSQCNFKHMLCRQIVRDHSEWSNRRRCGIELENVNGNICLKVILAKA